MASQAYIAPGFRGWWLRRGRYIFSYGVLTVLALTMLAPFLWMLLASFKPLVEVEQLNPFPTQWKPINYIDVFREIPFARYYFNSVFVTAWTVLGQILSCSFIAYAFARLRWPGRDFYFVLLLGTMMLPPQVTMIPVFLIMKHIGWFNTLYPLWVPAFFGSAFYIFLLRQFMKTIPDDLEDAAKIDGCGYLGIYAKIILPLVKPALAAIGIFTFMGTWNDFMGPLIYINDQRLYPLSLGLFMFQTTHGAHFGMMMAASMLMTLPVIALFFFAQRYFIQGVTLTGMKG